MFTKRQQVEEWIRDNGLTWWRFTLDETGVQTTADGQQEQKRSNKVIILSDAYPGGLDEKIALTLKRLMTETTHVLYGQGKRGKENTGLMYCEVRLVDELQQPGTQPVSAIPSVPAFDEEKAIERIRKELKLEFENQQYQNERKQFEQERKQFEQEKASTIGALVHYFGPVIAAMAGNKRVAGLDAQAPVTAQPIQVASQDEVIEDEVFTEDEQDKLFDLMARFKSVEPRYLELIERVVTMADSGDATYDMAKGFLLK